MSALFHLRPGDVFAGQYRVEKPLAEGGMGAVFVVEQLSTGRRRALKVMQPQLLTDPKLVERFVQEARIGSRLESEHIVDVLDAGVDTQSGAPYLVMELLKGETLAERLTRGACSVPETLELVRQLAHGLGQAHAIQVVHRDLKPENIFLATTSSGGYRVKILDFGIAKVLEDAKTRSTGALGTPLFMPPEQMTPGRAITPASDVWALGLIVFQCLAGRSYWHAATAGGSQLMLMNEVTNLPIEPATVRVRSLEISQPLPNGFDAWFGRTVVRDPSARFQSAPEAYQALERTLSGEPPAIPVSSSTVAGAPLSQAVHQPARTELGTPGAVVFQPPPPAAPRRAEQNSTKLWLGAGVGALALAGGIVLYVKPWKADGKSGQSKQGTETAPERTVSRSASANVSASAKKDLTPRELMTRPASGSPEIVVDMAALDRGAPPLGGPNVELPPTVGSVVDWMPLADVLIPNPGWSTKGVEGSPFLFCEPFSGWLHFSTGATVPAAYANNTFNNGDRLSGFSWGRAQPVTVGPDKLPGFFGMGRAKDKETGAEVKLFYVYVVTDSTQVLAIGQLVPNGDEQCLDGGIRIVGNIKRAPASSVQPPLSSSASGW